MATTLTVVSSRIGPTSFLDATVASVALDAVVSEEFILPSTFGELWIELVRADVTTLSGAYVAPTPAYDGVLVGIVSADGTTLIDMIGSSRFVNFSTASARPNLTVAIELYHRTILRQNEQLALVMPIIAGAGVTGTVRCSVRGYRTKVS